MARTRNDLSGTVLLVDDNKLDVILAEKCFEEVAPNIEIHDVENGLEALAFLRREGRYSDAANPDLVLLDLNMPMMDGRELLAEIVRDEELKRLPVVILTNSHSDEDVLHTYNLRASSYIRKPVDFEQFEEVVKKIVGYWFDLVVLPHRDELRNFKTDASGLESDTRKRR